MKNKISELVKNVGDTVSSASSAAIGSLSEVRRSAVELGKSAGDVIGDAVDATSNVASRAGDSISETASKSFDAIKNGAGIVSDSAVSGAKSAGAVLRTGAEVAGDTLSAVGVLVGDLNGDGKVDFEDAKIAAAKVKYVAAEAATEVGKLGKAALQSNLVKDAAAGAVVGGVLASMVPIPIVSTLTGATAGAALGAYKSIGKK